MSIKRILLITSLTATCSAAFAATAPVMTSPSSAFNGFYVGLAGGADTFSYHIKEYSGTTLEATAKNSSRIGAIGQLNAGYQYTFSNNWLLGGEIFSNLTSFESKNTANLNILGATYTTTTKLTDSYDFGFDAQGGYVWHDNLFYGLAGMTFSHLRLEQDDVLTGTPLYNEAITKFAGGYTLGLGVQQAITAHLRLREQATYTLYPSTTYHYPDTMFVDQVNATSLQRMNFLFGLAYQF